MDRWFSLPSSPMARISSHQYCTPSCVPPFSSPRDGTGQDRRGHELRRSSDRHLGSLAHYNPLQPTTTYYSPPSISSGGFVFPLTQTQTRSQSQSQSQWWQVGGQEPQHAALSRFSSRTNTNTTLLPFLDDDYHSRDLGQPQPQPQPPGKITLDLVA
ncbi:hypothetical protein WAI453_003720 [Rhynchosporium graminicola]